MRDEKKRNHKKKLKMVSALALPITVIIQKSGKYNWKFRVGVDFFQQLFFHFEF